MADSFHFPPELMSLLIDTIPRLNRSKKDLLLFFASCGVEDSLLRKYISALAKDKASVNKFNVTREILTALNEGGDRMLGTRRQLLQRVVCFDSFDVCWDNDRDRAKANVAEIGRIVKLKDTVTRFEQVAEREQQSIIRQNQHRLQLIAEKKKQFQTLKNQLMELFSMDNPHKRGKALEAALNNLFDFFQVGIEEAFCVYDEESGKCYEQVDGVIEIGNNLLLVEMKWEKNPIGAEPIGRLIGRTFTKAGVDAALISYSGFAETGVKVANDALSQRVIILVELRDIVSILNLEKDLKEYFATKIKYAKLYGKSNYHVNISELQDLDFISLVGK